MTSMARREERGRGGARVEGRRLRGLHMCTNRTRTFLTNLSQDDSEKFAFVVFAMVVTQHTQESWASMENNTARKANTEISARPP